MGLREQIMRAGSMDEIVALQKQGEAFKSASKRTRRAWESAVDRRTKDLGRKVEIQAAPERDKKQRRK